jgi:hypothetical protein
MDDASKRPAKILVPPSLYNYYKGFVTPSLDWRTARDWKRLER